MRKDLTSISVFSMAISFVAAIVVCMQVGQMEALPGWKMPEAILWSLEVAIFGVAVLAWQPQVSLLGWVMGIGALSVLRSAVGLAAAVTLVVVQDVGHVLPVIDQMSQLAPRLCAALFALMVFYPLRVLLPVKPLERSTDRKRFARGAAASANGTGSEEKGSGLMIMAASGANRAAPAESAPWAEAEGQYLPSASVQGTIELPLRVLLAELPQELVTERAAHHDESELVSIPMKVVVRQLREAQIVVTLDDCYDWLPSGVMGSPGEFAVSDEGAASVILPLELVVPQLPPEVFELPPPSPPAWAQAEVDERVVFATTQESGG